MAFQKKTKRLNLDSQDYQITLITIIKVIKHIPYITVPTMVLKPWLAQM